MNPDRTLKSNMPNIFCTKYTVPSFHTVSASNGGYIARGVFSPTPNLKKKEGGNRGQTDSEYALVT